MRLAHVYSAWMPKDLPGTRRCAIAHATWRVLPWVDIPIKDEALPRRFDERQPDGKVVQLTYVKDLLNRGVLEARKQGLGAQDILVLTNGDTCLTTDALEKTKSVLTQSNACYAFRRDFARLDRVLRDNEVGAGTLYAGSDLYAFTIAWWLNFSADYPDMLLGREGWDAVMRVLIEQTNQGKVVEVKDIIYHQRHDSWWEKNENRWSLSGQLHALRTGWNWLSAHGKNPATYGFRRI